MSVFIHTRVHTTLTHTHRHTRVYQLVVLLVEVRLRKLLPSHRVPNDAHPDRSGAHQLLTRRCPRHAVQLELLATPPQPRPRPARPHGHGGGTFHGRRVPYLARPVVGRGRHRRRRHGGISDAGEGERREREVREREREREREKGLVETQEGVTTRNRSLTTLVSPEYGIFVPRLGYEFQLPFPQVVHPDAPVLKGSHESIGERDVAKPDEPRPHGRHRPLRLPL